MNMKYKFGTLTGFFKNKKDTNLNTEVKQSYAYYGELNDMSIYPNSTRIIYYNGEKNEGAIGQANDYKIDFDTLRKRCWKAVMYNEIAGTVINSTTTWVIGNGLRLQAEPEQDTLAIMGVQKANYKKFQKNIESLWRVYSNSKEASLNGEKTFNELQKEAYRNAEVGGDILVVVHIKNGDVKIQHIDGQYVRNPDYQQIEDAKKRGNHVFMGIERTNLGEHVAYFVKLEDGTYARVPAFLDNLRVAFLYKCTLHRIDHERGIGILSSSLETLEVIDRYSQATLATAEELSKITLKITSDNSTDGSNPFAKLAVEKRYAGTAQEAKTEDGVSMENRVKMTTNKQAIYAGVGNDIQPINQPTGTLYFEQFHKTHSNIVYANTEIVPDVARSTYENSFSASRAGLKDWEHRVSCKRQKFIDGYLRYVYKAFVYVHVNMGNIQAPRLKDAIDKSNSILANAWLNARFVGATIPHIDPLKEVNAVRAMLGDSASHVPLTTMEEATEKLGGGYFAPNLLQFADELEDSRKLKVTPIEQIQKTNNTTTQN